MRWLLILAAFPCGAWAADVTFNLCPGAMRVQRSVDNPKAMEIYCVGETKPRLILQDCVKPANVTTQPNGDKVIRCPGGGLPVIVRTAP